MAWGWGEGVGALCSRRTYLFVVVIFNLFTFWLCYKAFGILVP